MKTKKLLIPKQKMWISITLILLPIILLILLDIFGYSINTIKAKAFTSFSLLGMFLLFMTQWTKDDGDEMYLQMRLGASLSSIVFGVILQIIQSCFDVLDIWKDGSESNASTSLSMLFMILWWQLFIFGYQMYKSKKGLNEKQH